MTMTYRDEKGSPLTSAEVDTNFRELVASDDAIAGRVTDAQATADSAASAAQAAQGSANTAQSTADGAQAAASAAQTSANNAQASANSKQPLNANLTALAAQVGTALRLLVWTGASSLGQLAYTAFGATLLSASDAAAARTALGLGNAALATIAASSSTTAGQVLAVGYMSYGSHLATQGLIIRADALNSITVTGNHYADTSSAGQGQLPVPNNGYVQTLAYAADSCVQIYTRVSDGVQWRRVRLNGTWQTWKQLIAAGEFGIGGAVVYMGSASLDTITKTGFYFSQSTNGTPSGQSYGYVTHEAVDDTSAFQTFTHYSNGQKYLRYKNNNVWDAWQNSVLAGTFELSGNSGLAMRSGDHGWGSGATPTITDLNAIRVNCRVLASNAATSGLPQGEGFGYLDNWSINSTYGVQRFTRLGATVIYERHRTDNSWSAWVNVTPLGAGQIPRDMTSVRALGTTYTNNTGRPIQVNVWAGPTSAVGVVLIAVVAGVQFARSNYAAIANTYVAINAIAVNPGETYQINVANGTASLGGWSERTLASAP